MVEVGAGRLIEEIETALTGASAGETRQATYELADESSASVEITVKEIKEKVLPELDDDLARSASEFDTLAELRGDIEGRLREQLDAEIDSVFRANAVDTLVARVEGEPGRPARRVAHARAADGVRALARAPRRSRRRTTSS